MVEIQGKKIIFIFRINCLQATAMGKMIYSEKKSDQLFFSQIKKKKWHSLPVLCTIDNFKIDFFKSKF